MALAVVLLFGDVASTRGVRWYIFGKWEMMWRYKWGEIETSGCS